MIYGVCVSNKFLVYISTVVSSVDLMVFQKRVLPSQCVEHLAYCTQLAKILA